MAPADPGRLRRPPPFSTPALRQFLLSSAVLQLILFSFLSSSHPQKPPYRTAEVQPPVPQHRPLALKTRRLPGYSPYNNLHLQSPLLPPTTTVPCQLNQTIQVPLPTLPSPHLT
jgi:hypothetical protein